MLALIKTWADLQTEKSDGEEIPSQVIDKIRAAFQAVYGFDPDEMEERKENDSEDEKK